MWAVADDVIKNRFYTIYRDDGAGKKRLCARLALYSQSEKWQSKCEKISCSVMPCVLSRFFEKNKLYFGVFWCMIKNDTERISKEKSREKRIRRQANE